MPPGPAPSLPLQDAVHLQWEMLDGFGKFEFQARLADLRRKMQEAPSAKEKNKLNVERQKLFLEVQSAVLPKYGMAGDSRGVFQMMQAFEPHGADGLFGMQGLVLNQLLGLDGAGRPLDPPNLPSGEAPFAEGKGIPARTAAWQHHWPRASGQVGATGTAPAVAPSDLAPSKIWPLTLGGFAFLSAPVIDAEMNIYVLWAQGVLALSPEGDVVRRFHVPEAVGSPALSSGAEVCAVSKLGEAFCFDIDSGAQLWRTKYAAAIFGSATAQLDVVDGHTLVVPGSVDGTPVNNFVFGIAMSDGALVWRFATGPQQNFLPASAGGKVVFTGILGGCACLNSRSGSVIWYHPGTKPSASPTSTTMSPAGAAICLPSNAVCVALNQSGEVGWNKPLGGQGRVRVLDLATGVRRWEVAFDFEANVTPTIFPSPGDSSNAVIVCLGSAAGPPAGLEGEEPTGDFFEGKVVALELATGTKRWETSPFFWPSPSCMACSAAKNQNFRVPVFSTPIVAADGRIFLLWHGGFLFILDGASGEQVEMREMAYPGIAPAALAPNMLVVASVARLHIFRSPQPGPRLALDLACSFEESGTEHFWPFKNCRNDHTLSTLSCGPRDLSRPSWTFEIPHQGRTYPFSNNFYCNPLIDAQRNIYNATDSGPLFVHRADGSLRGSVYLGPRITTPVISGKSLFLANADGYAFRVNIETLAVEWSCRYASFASSDTWMPTLSEKVLIVGGLLIRAWCTPHHPSIDPQGHGIPPEAWDSGQTHVFGLDPATGETKWVWCPDWLVYNLNPTFLVYGDVEVAVIMDNSGGYYMVNTENGECVWKRPASLSPPTFNDICGVTMAPNRIFLGGYQDPQDQRTGPRGEYPQQSGIVEAFDARTFPPRKLWEVRPGYAQMLQAVFVPVAGGVEEKYLAVLPMGENCLMPHCPLTDEGPPQSANFEGMLFGLDMENGQVVWSFAPPMWRSANGSCRGSHWWCCYLPASWCSPIVGGDGTVYVYWHAGLFYALEGATGRVLSSYDLGSCITGSAALAPGLVVVQAQQRVICWKDTDQEDSWLADSLRAGDPRASVKRVGAGVSEEAKLRGICWGLSEAYKQPPPEIEAKVARLKAAAEGAEDPARAPAAPPPGGAPAAGPGGDAPARASAAAAGAEGAYLVVGGERSGGIAVRKGASLRSAEEPARLATGSRVRILQRSGERVQFRKLTGEGPEQGWVSLSFKGKDLLRPAE